MNDHKMPACPSARSGVTTTQMGQAMYQLGHAAQQSAALGEQRSAKARSTLGWDRRLMRPSVSFQSE